MKKEKIEYEAAGVIQAFENIGVDITDYDNLRDGLFIELINYERNESLLSITPHYRLSDLAVVARCGLDTECGYGSMLVTDPLLEIWNVTPEDILKEAKENSELRYPLVFDRLDNFVAGFSPLPELEEMEFPFYYVTNPCYKYGAAAIVYPGSLERIYEKMGGAFYIIPSSINEMLILPEDIEMSEQVLLDMIRDVNDNVVPKDEVLSYNLYLCKKADCEPEIITGF